MRRILPTTYAAIVGTAVVGIVLLRISFPVFLHQGISQAVAGAIPFGFQAREIRIDFLRSRAVFSGVLVGDGRFALLAPRVVTQFSLAGFRAGDVRVTDITIERPLLKVRDRITFPASADSVEGFPRVSANDGRLRIAIPGVPEWTASGITVDWSGEALTASASSVIPPASRYLPSEASVSFSAYRIREGWDAAAKSSWPDGSLELSGRFEAATGVFTGEGDYRGIPAAGFPFEVKKLHCSFTAQGKGRLSVDGTVSSSTAVLSGVPLLLTGGVTADPAGVRVNDLSVLLPDGKAVVNGSLLRSDAVWTSSGTALLEGISPVRLAATAGMLDGEGLPEVTRTNGNISWDWRGEGQPLTFSTDAEFALFRRGVGGQLRLAAEGSLGGGVLTLQEALVTWPDSRLSLSGVLSAADGWDTTFELTSSRIAGTLAMVAKDFSLLDGQGSYRGRIGGPLASPEVTGELSLAPLAFGDSVIETVSGTLVVRGASLSSPGLLLSLRGGRTRVAGSVTIDDDIALDLKGEITDYPLADLIGMFLPPWATAARISTRFTLKGIEERSSGGGPVTITGLSFGGIDVSRLTGTVVWEPTGLTMTGARIESAVGSWTGSLSLPFDGGIGGTISTASLPLPPAIAGIFSRATGSISLGGNMDSPAFDGQFRLGWGGALAGRPDLLLRGTGSTAAITVSGASEGILKVEGTVEPMTLRFSATARGDLPAVPVEIPRIGAGELTVSGIRVTLSGEADQPSRAVGETSWDSLSFTSPAPWSPVQTGPATASLRRGVLLFESIRATVGPLTGLFSGSVSTAGPILSAQGEAPVGALASLVPLPAGISVGDGTAEVTAAIAGSWSSPTITGELAIPRCTVTGLPLIGTLPGVEVALSWDGEKGAVRASALYRELPLKASAAIGAKGLSPVRIEGTLPVEVLDEIGITLLQEGSLSFSGEVPIDDPVLGAKGTLSLKGGAATLGNRGRITALRGSGTFEDGVLRIPSLAGSYGEGEITGSGWLDYSTPSVPRWEVSTSARDLFIGYPGEAELLLDADTVLTGSPRGSLLKGRIVIGKGTYLRTIAGAPALRILPSAPASVPQIPQALSDMEVDLELVTRRPFAVTSNQADALLEGRVRASGPLRHPVLSGEVRAVRGEFYYLSRRFRILEGSVLFTGERGFNPFIVLSAVTEVDKTSIYLNTQSNLSSLTLNLSSTPPYGREDIVALLTFGQTVTGLRGKGEAVSAMAAASIVGGEILGRIEEEARRSLSLSVFQIDPEASQGDGTTDLRFTLGKKVSDRLSLFWSQRLTGSERQSFSAEYRIFDFLTITGERDSEGQNNFDLRVDLGF